jgi:hypothetical protein
MKRFETTSLGTTVLVLVEAGAFTEWGTIRVRWPMTSGAGFVGLTTRVRSDGFMTCLTTPSTKIVTT